MCGEQEQSAVLSISNQFHTIRLYWKVLLSLSNVEKGFFFLLKGSELHMFRLKENLKLDCDIFTGGFSNMYDTTQFGIWFEFND